MKLTEDAVTFYRPWDPHKHLRSPAQIGERAFQKLVELNTIHYAVVIAEPNVAGRLKLAFDIFFFVFGMIGG